MNWLSKTPFVLQKEIVEQINSWTSSLVMGSLDVDSLFINIGLDETTDICTNTIYSEQDE